jgi:hypothetical protein
MKIRKFKDSKKDKLIEKLGRENTSLLIQNAVLNVELMQSIAKRKYSISGTFGSNEQEKFKV